MKIHDYNAAEGMAFQGDVSIIPIPEGVEIDTANEIEPINGRLILQEGEVTGHHHAIKLGRERNFKSAEAIAPEGRTTSSRLARAFGASMKMGESRQKANIAVARMYRDPRVAQTMRARGLLSRDTLAVGCLVVESDSVVVSHEEHDSIRLAGGDGSSKQPAKSWLGGYIFRAGRYLIGRQIESAGAEERAVAD